VALDFLVLLEGEQVDEGLEEAGFDDGRFVGWVDGDVSNAGGGGEDEREVGGVEESKERRETVRANDFELVFLCGRGDGEKKKGEMSWKGER